MNAADVKRFDELHTRKRNGEVLDHPTEVEYQVLLERVVLGKDGKSEFPTEPTEIMAALQRKQFCEAKAREIFAEVVKYGPEVIAALIRMLAK